jgi:hypothetical protein
MKPLEPMEPRLNVQRWQIIMIALNLESELMSAAALRDEEYARQVVNRYSDIQDS